jgi:hypothetical protein
LALKVVARFATLARSLALRFLKLEMEGLKLEYREQTVGDMTVGT